MNKMEVYFVYFILSLQNHKSGFGKKNHPDHHLFEFIELININSKNQVYSLKNYKLLDQQNLFQI